MYINDILLNFQVEICSHGHTHIYMLYNDNFVYDKNKTYEIIIDDKNITTKINNYPKFENEIIMSTIVKNEDKYILQWIKYHNILGIKRFIIYDNSTNNTLYTLLNNNITNNIFIIINWQYEHIYQQTQQNHSIYAFNKSKYIGLFDIDEYINLQEPYIQIDNFLSDIIKIDDVNIFKFAFFVIILLSFACFFFSRVTSIFLLFIAIFLMRFSGQGMMSHTASTTISRYFTQTRGRALSISWFGLSSAEFIMPVLMVYLLTIIDWQNLWLIFSISVLIILPIVSLCQFHFLGYFSFINK